MNRLALALIASTVLGLTDDAGSVADAGGRVSSAGCASGKVCRGGACGACSSNTQCATAQTCFSGACIECQGGVACSTNPNACRTGVSDCTSGALVCANTATHSSPGTSCGSNQVCDPGGACATNPSKCKAGVGSCATGATAPFKVACDMTTDGGGWTLLAYGLNAAVPIDPKYAAVGEYVTSSAIPFPYTQMRLQCKAANGVTVYRIRTMAAATTVLDAVSGATSETYDATDTVSTRPSGLGFYQTQTYTEWHGFAGTAYRFIVRTSATGPHCAQPYESLGITPTLAQWAQVWAK